MSLGSIKKAYETYKQHDFSRSFQLRILDMNNVPNYVRKELIDSEGRLYASSFSVPGRSISDIPIKYQGFEFHVPGQVKYDGDWKITFKTPGDYLVRNALERWSFETANDETACGKFNIPCESTSIDIAVLSPKCEVIRVYRLHGVYLGSLGSIGYDQTDTKETTFDATFKYQYWRPAGGYDSGLNEDLNSNNSLIDDTFASYGNKIQQGIGSCPAPGIPVV